MLLTFNDLMVLFALISFAGFISYTAHEVGNAFHDWLNDY
jgi:hypothetical protein